MCGISGTLAFTNNDFRVTSDYVRAMRDTMAHRGPDGSGIWISADARIGLGHRRLSIIDLSDAASQPMSNEDGSLRVTFNGEIYNHAEIRAELERLGGHVWKTDHSDTEVILHAFEQWGIDCIQRFRGMFAFGLWDAQRRELWLVRDRLGVKPLYYSVHHGRITFASEIKALLQDPDQKREVNEEALYHYLSFLTAPVPLTLFGGIRKLPCATWLKVTATGQMVEHRYWDVWDHTRDLSGASEADICRLVLDELRKAVRLRKVSDVPVGVFLSGGIDSSTNAALFSEGENSIVDTFSIGYEGNYSSYKNELDFARQMAKQVNARYHETLLTQEDLLDFLPRMVELQDEPIADPVCVPVYYVSKLARDNGVIVCQVGEGSDELFWGYPRWKAMLNLQRADNLPVPHLFKRAGLLALRCARRQESLPYELLRRGAEGLPVFWSGAEAFTEEQKRALLSPAIRRRLSAVSSWEPLQALRERFESASWEPSPLHWMTYVDLNLRLPELLLMRVDKMGMGASVEGRVPFLDHKFVELAMSIPSSLKTRGGQLKYVLKKAVRGLIPDNLIDRKKQGFGVPVYEWLFGTWGAYAVQELRQFCARTDYFDFNQVMSYVKAGSGAQVWYLLNLALWWNHYIAEDDNRKWRAGNTARRGPTNVTVAQI